MLNFSKSIYLNKLCKYVIQELETQKKDVTKIILEIEEQIYKSEKRVCAVWGRTLSDKYFSDFLIRLKNIILKNEVNVTDVQNLLDEINQCSNKKLRILILAQEVSVWPSLDSVFRAAQENEHVEVKLVHTPFTHANFTSDVDNYDIYRYEMQLPIIRHEKYDLTQESPDIVFVQKPYNSIPEKYTISILSKIIERIVYIPYGLELTTRLRKFGFQYFAHYKAWRHIVYGDIVKEYAIKYGYRNGENIAVLGHPKADSYRDMKEVRKSIPESWKLKIKGRKVILWTPHHLVDLDNDEHTSTWLIWHETILSYFRENRDVVLLFRPHPLMFGALINKYYMTKDQKQDLINSLSSQENVIVDDTNDYRYSFYASDGIITDGTSFSFEYLYTGNPEMLTPRNIKDLYYSDELQEALYIPNSPEDIHAFIKMVISGHDPKCQIRKAFSDKLFYRPSGITVGENIVNYIYNEIIKEESIRRCNCYD